MVNYNQMNYLVTNTQCTDRKKAMSEVTPGHWYYSKNHINSK